MASHHGGDESVERGFDWDSVRPSVAVVDMFTAEMDRVVEELPPLIETIDPEALDDLFFRHDGCVDLAVSFTYDDTTVTVCGDGTVCFDNR